MKKIKNLCFCLIPATIGILIIVFNLAIVFNKGTGMLYQNYNWAFFWVFVGFASISYSLVSILEVCKRK